MDLTDSIKKILSKILSKRELPTVLGVDLGPTSRLTYWKIKEIIECLNDYLSEIKRLPRSLSELVRVSNNFCNHVIKVLMEYREIMVSDVDSTNFSEYKKKLIETLKRLENECKNKNVLRFKKDEYEDIFGADALNIKRGENSNFIGDFAESLGNVAKRDRDDIEKYAETNYAGLTKYLEIDKLSSVRKFIARFKSNVTNPLAGAGLRAVSGALYGAKRLFSNMFLVEEVEPIEYFNFEKSKYLGRSTVHGASNIMNSYKKMLKDYPKELINYVNNCLYWIEKIDALLKSYLKFLEVFINPKRTRVDEIKAKQGMENELDELLVLIEQSLKNACIFCLKENEDSKNIPNNIDFGYNEQRVQWLNSSSQNSNRGLFGTVCKRNSTRNIDDQLIVLKGWSLGHFLHEFKPVVENTKAKLNDLINFESNTINYEELEIKKLRLNRTALNDVTEMVKKADALKKKIKTLYIKVQDLATSEDFKKEPEISKKLGVIGYDELFGKDGKYALFLDAYKKFVSQSSTAKVDSGGSLKQCSKYFSEMNKYAQEIEEKCEFWISYYSEDASKGKKKKENDQKRVLDNIKLFKRRFSKVFNEAKDLAKKSEKEFNSVMKLKETGADADLLATYKQTLMNKYPEFMKGFTFSLPFLNGMLVVFDYNGFKEDNLYNCVKHVDNIETFSNDRANELQRRLGELKQNSEKFNAKCEEVIKLFGKKNKENLQELSKTFNGLVKTLEKAIKDYKSAKKLNEEFEKEYKNKKISKGFENDEHVWNYNSLIAKFEGAWEYLSSDYKKFELDETGEVIKDNSVILENVRAISKDSAETTIENENKRKQCDKLTQNIQSRLIGMREVFGKIKDLAEVIDIMQENTRYVAPKLIKAREDYKDAIELNNKFIALSGEAKFGKAFTRNGSVKWFEQYWSGIQKQIDELKSVSDIDISGPVPSAEEVSSISADQKKAGEVTKVLEDITSYCKDMHGYFKEIEKLVEDLAQEKLEISEVLKGAIENYKAVEALFSDEYSLLYGAGTEGFVNNSNVKEFKGLRDDTTTKMGDLNDAGAVKLSKSSYTPDETGILNMLFDYTQNNFEKYNECKAISKEIESNLKEMQKLIEPIRKLSKELAQKDEKLAWLSTLVEEYKAYNGKELTKLVDDCKKCADELGMTKTLFAKRTDWEARIRAWEQSEEKWHENKKLYSDTIGEYNKSKKALEEAIKKLGETNADSIRSGLFKKFDNAGIESMLKSVKKVKYTSTQEIRTKLEEFSKWVVKEKVRVEKFEKSKEKTTK